MGDSSRDLTLVVTDIWPYPTEEITSLKINFPACVDQVHESVLDSHAFCYIDKDPNIDTAICTV